MYSSYYTRPAGSSDYRVAYNVAESYNLPGSRMFIHTFEANLLTRVLIFTVLQPDAIYNYTVSNTYVHTIV